MLIFMGTAKAICNCTSIAYLNSLYRVAKWALFWYSKKFLGGYQFYLNSSTCINSMTIEDLVERFFISIDVCDVKIIINNTVVLLFNCWVKRKRVVFKLLGAKILIYLKRLFSVDLKVNIKNRWSSRLRLEISSKIASLQVSTSIFSLIKIS